MLSKIHRLPYQAIQSVKRVGKKLHYSTCDIVYAPNGDARLLLTCIVPKSVDARSVIRHSLKRLVHRVFEEPRFASIPLQVVVIVHRPAALDQARLKQELERFVQSQVSS